MVEYGNFCKQTAPPLFSPFDVEFGIIWCCADMTTLFAWLYRSLVIVIQCFAVLLWLTEGGFLYRSLELVFIVLLGCSDFQHDDVYIVHFNWHLIVYCFDFQDSDFTLLYLIIIIYECYFTLFLFCFTYVHLEYFA